MDRDTPVARRRRTERGHAGEPSSAVAVETTNGGKTTWLWEAGGRLVETRSVTAEQTSASNTEEAEDEEWIISDDDALPLIWSDRPLPISCPKFPEGGSREEIAEWHRATTIAYEKAANDPVSNPPILRETKGRETKGMKTPSFTEVISTRQREVLFRLSSSIVSISSIRVGDGKEIPNWKFTGIVIGPSESDEHARILTSSKTVCDYDGKLLDRKLLVRLPNKAIKDGELLFFDPYYGIAVLEISVDKPLRCPSFVSSPEYGDEVFVLARGEDSSLLTATGRVMCHNESYLDRNYYLYVSCVLPERSICGLVIDRDGDVTGMAFFVDWSKTAVLPSFIIRTLVEMERNFRCIARPVHGLCLRAVQFLDIHKREEILYEHNIDSGYIVDEVEMDSTAEIVGIRDGDVIVSFNGMRAQTMPELEHYLLLLGWKFLERKSGSSKVVLKLKVYDPINIQERIVNLPLGFSRFPSVKERVKVQGIKRKKTTPVVMPSGRVLRPRKKNPVTHPPILRETKDFDTSSSTSDELYSSSSRHREVIVGLARSIVSISSTGDDGLPEWNFNGIVIGPSESDERARILTSSETVCDYKGKLDHKLLVRLPNKVIKDGELLFFDHYYGLAILEISVDMPLRCPSFMSSPDYGDKVFVLTRNEDSSLMTTTGKVLWHNKPYFGRNHYLYLSCELPERISGGLVMDRDGDIAGMTFDCASPKTAVLPSFIIKKLIEMESNFRCIARPVHGLSLRAVQFLDMSRREEILYKHNIDSGYLVDEVGINSTAEIIGIRRGDVIVSVNGMCSQNMLKLEEYLLSLGWKFLERKIESSKIVLKLKVYDPLNCRENTLSLPLGFSCLTSGKERVKVQVTKKTFASASHGIKRKKNTPEPKSSERVLRPRKKSEKK